MSDMDNDEEGEHEMNRIFRIKGLKYVIAVLFAVTMMTGLNDLCSFAGNALEKVYAEENEQIEYKTYMGIIYKLRIVKNGGYVDGKSTIIGYNEETIVERPELLIAPISKEGYVCLLEGIEEGAFENCTTLKYIRVSTLVYDIKPRTFSGCTNLEHVELHTNIESIGDSAFKDCKNLKTLGEFFEENVMKKITISKNAFVGCEKYDYSQFVTVTKTEENTNSSKNIYPVITCNTTSYYGPTVWNDRFEEKVILDLKDKAEDNYLVINGKNVQLKELPYTLENGNYEIIATNNSNYSTKINITVCETAKTSEQEQNNTEKVENTKKKTLSLKEVKAKKINIISVKRNKKTARLKLEKVSGAKYEIQIGTTKEFLKKTSKTYRTSNRIYKIKKLNSENIYYTRARIYKKNKKGQRVYGKWSKVIKIKK